MIFYKICQDTAVQEEIQPAEIERDKSEVKYDLYKRLKDEIFIKSKLANVKWASFGLIKCQDDKDQKAVRHKYVWVNYYLDASDELKKIVNDYVADVNSNPTNYLVLAQLGEEVFSKTNILQRCYVMSDDDICIDGFEIQKWSVKEEAFKSFITDLTISKAEAYDLKKRWNNYINAVKGATSNFSNTIVYIPLICNLVGREKALAGGVVLCIEKGKLQALADIICELQLTLRWMMTDILIHNHHLGKKANTDDFIEKIEKNKWFKNGGHEIDHTFSAESSWQNKVKDHLRPYLGVIENYSEELHLFLKNFATRNDKYEISPAILYVLAVAARNQKHYNIRSLNELSVSSRTNTYSFRKSIGNYSCCDKILKYYYQFVKLTVINKSTHDLMLDDIVLLDKSIKLIYNKPSLASEICKKLEDNLYKDKLSWEDNDVSANLANIILYSGWNLKRRICTDKDHNTCQGNSCIIFYQYDNKSVFEIYGAEQPDY